MAGFAGVLVIVRPWGAEFHPAMLASVVNALLYAVFLMMTRRLAAYDSPETIQYLPAVGAAIGLAPFAFAAWESPRAGSNGPSPACSACSAASATTCLRSRTAMLLPA